MIIDRIISYMYRFSRPVYVGFIALEIGYSLARTQVMMDDLVLEGRVRAFTVDEKKRLGMHPDANIWVLNDTEHPRRS